MIINEEEGWHEGRPSVERMGDRMVVLCPVRHVREVLPVAEWAWSSLEARAGDLTWTVRCYGSLRANR